MADLISARIDQIHPSVSGTDIVLSDTVRVLFDREMDEDSISSSIFITGPDFDYHTGPDRQTWIDFNTTTSEDDVLESPGLHGIVQGTFLFERVDLATETVVGTQDVIGSGILYRTRATFTPTQALGANTTYQVFIAGDEALTDGLSTGISTRTIYDPIKLPGNTSTADPTFTGSYTASVADTYTIEIVAGGAVGTATFRYWTALLPTPSGALRTRRAGTLLSSGVTIKFPEGTYVAGGQWTVVVKPRDIFSGNLTWPFQTGSGSIGVVPTTAATSVLGDTVGVTATSETFSVTSILPVLGASHQTFEDDVEYVITLVMSDTVDSSTVVSGVSVIVEATPVDGDSAAHPASGVLIANPVVTDDTIEISIAAHQLHENNLVEITLASTVASTGLVSLGTEYSSWFTTTYSPYYCTLRQIRLDIGAYIPQVSDDTINFAIMRGSEAADALTWNKTTGSDGFYQFVRQQFSCCKAQEVILLNSMKGAGTLKSKQLDNFRVEYAQSNNDALDRALACLAKWEAQLQAGGRKVSNSQPDYVVKGEWNPDQPNVGRQWGYLSSTPGLPAANTRYLNPGSRRYKNTYYPAYRGKKRYDA